MTNEKIYNFDINEGIFENEELLPPTEKNIGHELPYFNYPNWESLAHQYKNAAKGYSKELRMMTADRLCTFVNIYARPSAQSVVIFHSDKNQIVNASPKPTKDNFKFKLTGAFIDMPEGRYHYVMLDDVQRFNTLDLWGKYNKRSKYPFKVFKGGYRYGFVREDLIKISVPLENYNSISYKTSSVNHPIYHPEYYNYKYDYYEHPGNGLSYLYMLLPRLNPNSGVWVYPYTINRVTAYKNDGNPDFITDDNITPPKTDDTDTDKNKIIKYTALTAGAILLGRVLNG